MKRKNFTNRKQKRCEEAVNRYSRWNKLTPQEKLDDLDAHKYEAKKQRIKILREMEQKV